MFSADGPILKIQTHMDKEFDSMKPILSFHNYANHMGKLQNSPMDYIDMVCQHIDKHINLNIANDILF